MPRLTHLCGTGFCYQTAAVSPTTFSLGLSLGLRAVRWGQAFAKGTFERTASKGYYHSALLQATPSLAEPRGRCSLYIFSMLLGPRLLPLHLMRFTGALPYLVALLLCPGHYAKMVPKCPVKGTCSHGSRFCDGPTQVFRPSTCPGCFTEPCVTTQRLITKVCQCGFCFALDLRVS